MVINRRSILALALSGLIFGSIACAEPAKLEICAACHGEDGSGAGFTYVPIIAGTPAAHLEEALFAYLDGARRSLFIRNTVPNVMSSQITKTLNLHWVSRCMVNVQLTCGLRSAPISREIGIPWCR